jgi:hypothetical protein
MATRPRYLREGSSQRPRVPDYKTLRHRQQRIRLHTHKSPKYGISIGWLIGRDKQNKRQDRSIRSDPTSAFYGPLTRIAVSSVYYPYESRGPASFVFPQPSTMATHDTEHRRNATDLPFGRSADGVRMVFAWGLAKR